MNALLDEWVHALVDGRTPLAARVAVFDAIRNLAYATDAAHDARALLLYGRGDCLAKTALLVEALKWLGYPARRVRWLYRLPPWPQEAAALPCHKDVHSAAEIHLGGRWLLLDATHDPPLGRLGFTVACWDGWAATPPAYPPLGPAWQDGIDDDAAEAAIHRILTAGRTAPAPVWAAYRAAYNAALEHARATPSPPDCCTTPIPGP